MILITLILILRMIKLSNQECQCGKTNAIPRFKRVFGGHAAPQGKFPWQMYLQVKIINVEHLGILENYIIASFKQVNTRTF